MTNGNRVMVNNWEKIARQQQCMGDVTLFQFCSELYGDKVNL